jgi:hypothetical protein
VTDDPRTRQIVESALKSALLQILDGAPVKLASSAAASRVMGAVAAPRNDFNAEIVDRPAMRRAEARAARNKALLSELLGLEVTHGRLACGLLARRMHPNDPSEVEAEVKHLSRLRLRYRRARNTQCAAHDEQNG